MNTLDDFVMTRPATAARPLLGLTVLVVEDSRYASEALRLLCLRSGARIRRADTLQAARRHLRVYRPGAIIVDLGLPDGSGLDLIAELAMAQPRIDVILGMSGDDTAGPAARAAGAQGFLAKPLGQIALFQAAILAHLPPDRQPPAPRLVSAEAIDPDPVAYRDDLSLVAQGLTGEARLELGYLTQFLGGLARDAGDQPMQAAVDDIVRAQGHGAPTAAAVSHLAALVQSRLASGAPI
jgi:two-component system, OmpR family, response regulator